MFRMSSWSATPKNNLTAKRSSTDCCVCTYKRPFAGCHGSVNFRLSTLSGGCGEVHFRQEQACKEIATYDKSPGSTKAQATAQTSSSRLSRTLEQLKGFGLSGVLAYGLLNTLYYSVAFLFVWFAVAKVPSGQGTSAAVRNFLAVFATVWAGSQVTKLARAGGALLLAPVVTKILDHAQQRFKLSSTRQAFLLIVSICVTIALTIFGGVVFAWR